MESGDSTVFKFLDPFCRLKDSVAQGNEELRDSPIVFDVPVGGAFEYVLVVFDSVMESGNLFFEVVNFDVFVGVAPSDGCEEPFSDGSEDVGIEVRVLPLLAQSNSKLKEKS